MATKPEKTLEQIKAEAEEKAKKQAEKEAKAAAAAEEKAARQKAKEDAAAKKASESDSDSALDQIEKNTSASLKAEDTVRVFITPKNEKDKLWSGCVNGRWYTVKKGEFVEIPKSLEKLLRETEKVTRESEAMKGQRNTDGSVFVY